MQFKTLHLSIIIFLVFNTQLFSQISNATLHSTLTMVSVNGIQVPFQSGMPLPAFEKQESSERQIIDLSGNWKKKRFTADHDLSLTERSDDLVNTLSNIPLSNIPSVKFKGDIFWEDISVPSVENNMNQTPPEIYDDGVWYRRHFNVSNNADFPKYYKLMFYSVNYICDVWINGHWVGYHEGGYSSFAFDISNYLVGGDNVIAVRVDSPHQEWSGYSDNRCDIVPYNAADAWSQYEGIIHDVYIEVTNPVSVIRTNIVPNGSSGNITSSLVLNNSSSSGRNMTASFTVYGAAINSRTVLSEFAEDLSDGIVRCTNDVSCSIAGNSVAAISGNLSIPNPQQWYPQSSGSYSNLYIMKVVLLDQQTGEILDEYYTQFGIRSITVSGFRALLNDKPVFLTGINREEDDPLKGRSIDKNEIYNDLLKIKQMNCNFLRTSHYPNHPLTYLIADRIGLAVTEEIPIFWFEQVGWDHQNDLSLQRQIPDQMFREMVFRDYNRPSILLWSLNNESINTGGRGDFIYRMKHELTTSYDDKRLINQASSAECSKDGNGQGLFDITQSNCNIAGFTTYFGLYTGSCENSAHGQYYDRTKWFLDNFPSHYTSPFATYEFGTFVDPAGQLPYPANELGQKNVFDSTFRAFSEKALFDTNGAFNCEGVVMGVAYWNAFDFWVNEDSLAHANSNGKFQGYYGVYHMDRTTPRLISEDLRNTYAPYFNRGGLYIGIIPCDIGMKKGVNTNNNLPKHYALYQNYPNPFNPVTEIKYEIPKDGFVTIKIYDLLGRQVLKLVDEFKQAGYYSEEFNGANYASGVYFYRIESGSYMERKKMVLIK